MLISIIVPVYNEEKTVKEILEKINELDFWSKNTNLSKEIIVVDDKSIDGTREKLKNLEDLVNLFSNTIVCKNSMLNSF